MGCEGDGLPDGVGRGDRCLDHIPVVRRRGIAGQAIKTENHDRLTIPSTLNLLNEPWSDRALRALQG